MKNKNAMLKAVLIMGISTLALAACDTGDWFDDDATYAGNVKPPQTSVDTSVSSDQTMPPASTDAPQFTSSLPSPTSATTTTVTTTTPMAPPAPPVVNQYTGNLASVPQRPQASELPSAGQVQSTRQDLNADNQMLTGTLKDPMAGLNRVPDPMVTNPNAPQIAPIIPTTAPQQVLVAPQPPQQPMLVQQTTTTTMQQPVQPQPAYAQSAPIPMAAPMPTPMAAPMTANVPPPTDQNVAGRMLGLQATGPGKYSLVQLPPDSGIGSFAMTSSIVTSPPGNQINIAQYQDLRRVAAQYGMQRGRVRLVAYSNDPQSQDAMQRATTVAAYLIDLGVPATAIRLRIDPAPADATQAMQAAHKTDIYLEVPINK